MGGGNFEGNMAYGAVDLGMSVYGLGRYVLKSDAWRLFRYVSTDYAQAYNLAGKKVLAAEALADGVTISALVEEIRNKKD